MDEMNQQDTTGSVGPNYWMSVGIASLIFGLVIFVIGLISTYLTINSEPSGSLFSPVYLIGMLNCLIGAFGGMVGVWHYTKEHSISIQLGRGALIGFLIGVGLVVISAVLNQLWLVVDPDMTQNLIDSMIANVEAMDLPEEQRQAMMDQMVESARSQQQIGSQLLWGIPIFGILNLITGMIGAKVFSGE
ncbi:MAG: DUF4199 domain-containing protein [Balneolaceae bacterium]|nr:DUF4199 domain-containing protein [Balneolaceae bacterium]